MFQENQQETPQLSPDLSYDVINMLYFYISIGVEFLRLNKVIQCSCIQITETCIEVKWKFISGIDSG